MFRSNKTWNKKPSCKETLRKCTNNIPETVVVSVWLTQPGSSRRHIQKIKPPSNSWEHSSLNKKLVHWLSGAPRLFFCISYEEIIDLWHVHAEYIHSFWPLFHIIISSCRRRQHHCCSGGASRVFAFLLTVGPNGRAAAKRFHYY